MAGLFLALAIVKTALGTGRQHSMKRFTIAHVLSSFSSAEHLASALELARWQRQRGQSVLAVSLTEDWGALGESFRAAGVQVKCLGKRPGVDASLPLRLAKALSADNADVIHTHDSHALIYGAPAAGLSGIASVHTRHEADPELAQRLWAHRRSSTFVDAYVAASVELAHEAVEQGECDPARLHVILHAREPAAFRVELMAPQGGAGERYQLVYESVIVPRVRTPLVAGLMGG
jgi:hypothetical protein